MSINFITENATFTLDIPFRLSVGEDTSNLYVRGVGRCGLIVSVGPSGHGAWLGSWFNHQPRLSVITAAETSARLKAAGFTGDWQVGEAKDPSLMR
ncbi:hypothetical protein BH11ARM1_BH11ARM1_14740 [soil metagenome]